MSPDPECVNDASYVLGSLTPAERQAYERHLAGCPHCQASVQRLAGLPGLLALVSEDSVVREPPPVPPTLLPALLDQANFGRRRRRIVVTASLALAAACAALLAVVLVFRPAGAAATQASTLPSAQVPLTAVVPGPMSVSLSLTDKQWGTSITVICHYQEEHSADVAYQLVLVDRADQDHVAGSWSAIAGANSTVTAATSLHRNDIARVEVRLPDGKVLMEGSV